MAQRNPLKPAHSEAPHAVESFRGCWFVCVDGVRVQALTEGQVLEGLQRGELSPDTLVMAEGMSEWQRIADTPALCSSRLVFTGRPAVRHEAPPVLKVEALPSDPPPSSSEDPHGDLAHRARGFVTALLVGAGFSGLWH